MTPNESLDTGEKPISSHGGRRISSSTSKRQVGSSTSIENGNQRLSSQPTNRPFSAAKSLRGLGLDLRNQWLPVQPLDIVKQQVANQDASSNTVANANLVMPFGLFQNRL